MRDTIRSVFASLISLIIGLGFGLIMTSWMGENPIKVVGILSKSTFGSLYDFGMVLYYSTPLIFTGLSVAVAYQVGLFNIGAEGQMTVGALTGTALALMVPGAPVFIAIPIAILGCFLGGAFWGGIAGYLRAKRGSHEVITTIMLNFIAAGVVSYLTLYVFRNHDSQNPETAEVAKAYLIPQFKGLGGAPAGGSFLIACLSVFILEIFFTKSIFGFEWKSVGQNERASLFAGIKTAKYQWLSLTIGGGLAGLVGLSEIFGNAGKYQLDFSPGYGFMGIAVALLARGRPMGVLFSALLFAALHKGSIDLEFESEKVSKDVSLIFQALVILFVSATQLREFLTRKES